MAVLECVGVGDVMVVVWCWRVVAGTSLASAAHLLHACASSLLQIQPQHPYVRLTSRYIERAIQHYAVTFA